MLSLPTKERTSKGRKTNKLREQNLLPAVLYGPKTKTLNLELNYKDFEKVFDQARESSLITLEIEGKKEKPMVLIHDVQKDPLSDKYIHIDFYQPILTEEIEAPIPLVFVGEAPAVKELGGTLVKNISEIEVKALPQNLPHEIKVNVAGLNTFEDEILIKDLKVPENVKLIREPDEIVAHVAPSEKVEEELEKPIEEKVEEVERVEKEKKEEEVKESEVKEKAEKEKEKEESGSKKTS